MKKPKCFSDYGKGKCEKCPDKTKQKCYDKFMAETGNDGYGGL